MCFRPPTVGKKEINCPICGAVNPVTAKKCVKCGAEETPVTPKAPPPPRKGAPPLPKALPPRPVPKPPAGPPPDDADKEPDEKS